jgi:hypothetical protein
MKSRLSCIVLLAALAGGCAPDPTRPARFAPEAAPRTSDKNAESEAASNTESTAGTTEAPVVQPAPPPSPAPSCDAACTKACESYGEELADACATAWLSGCFEQPRREGADCTVRQPEPKAKAGSLKSSRERETLAEEAPAADSDTRSESGEGGQALPKLFGDP